MVARGGVVLLGVALAGCFNPSARDSEATGDPSTGEPATGDPTVTGATDTTDTTLPGTSPTTTEDPGTTSQAGCECPPETPYCTAMGCGTCNEFGSSNMNCGDLGDGSTPHCDPMSGLCVVCTLDEHCVGFSLCHPDTHTCVGCVDNADCDAPESGHCEPDSNTCGPCEIDADCSGFGPTATCDPDGHICRRCAEHSDCPETACDLALGECFPPGATTHAYVDEGSCEAMMDSPLCAEGKPCCEISDALKDAILGPQEHVVIHVNTGVYTSSVQVAVDDRRIAILAAEGVTLSPGEPGELALGLVDGASSTALFVSRVNVVGPTWVLGVLCGSGTGGLWFEDAHVRDIAGPGMFAIGCTIEARRAVIASNEMGVQASIGGTIRLENSAVVGSHTYFALSALSNGTLDLVYTSVLDRDAAENHLLECGSQPLMVRNSIVATAFIGGFVPGCTVVPTRSAVSPGVTTDPPPDFVIDPATFAAVFNNPDNDDLHLLSQDSPILMLARWQTGDPPTDLDGKQRTTVNDAPDAAGAYLP